MDGAGRVRSLCRQSCLPSLLPSCSLYDIYWSEEFEERLHALQDSRPNLKIIF